MTPLWFALAVAATGVDRVDTVVHAVVAPALDRVHVEVSTEYFPADDLEYLEIALPAERYRSLPPGFVTVRGKEIFPNGFSFGGFDDVAVTIDGVPCTTRIEGALRCAHRAEAGERIAVEIKAELQVPERFGAFGHVNRQLTLAGGWYPYVARADRSAPRGRHRMDVALPPSFGAVLGARWFAPIPGEARKIALTIEDTPNVALFVLPPTAIALPAGDDRSFVVVPRGGHEPEDEVEEVLRTFRETSLFARANALDGNDARVGIIAPLRHELAIATDGVTLVSDRAFRMLPIERAFRFHRFPILRAIMGSQLVHEKMPRVVAEATSAWLADQYVRSRFGRAEDAFDVLGFWSFIPAVDLLLYAPDMPFESAYFKRVDDTDPLTPNVIDFPAPEGHGRVVYEKLLDRIGLVATDRVFDRVVHGETLRASIAHEIDDPDAFLATWLAPYPSVRYSLGAWSSAPEGSHYRATVEIARDGDIVAEPVEVLLRDDDGHDRYVWAETSSSAVRVLTATLAAPLDMVEVDPHGRVIEKPTLFVPSPRFDNRSSSPMKVILNSWNIALAATEGSLETALDVGLQRQYDVHWRHAIRADLDPASIGLSARSSYSFGANVTKARLANAIGMSVESAYLRPKFGAAAESAVALAGSLYYLYDTRQSIWAAEPGISLGATLEYSHVFGRVLEEITGEEAREVSQDALSISFRALKAWRFLGQHQLTVRATAGAYLFGDPRRQLLFRLGGRGNARGYVADALLGEARAVGTVEWVHPVLPNLDENFFYFTWVTGLDGALFGDIAVLARDLESIGSAPIRGDVGYGVRIYIDYFGVRPGVMSLDLAFPLADPVGQPAVYLDFSQSF